MPVRGDARVAVGFGGRSSYAGREHEERCAVAAIARWARDAGSLIGMQAGRCAARRSSEPCDRGAPRQTKRGRGASRARLHSRCDCRSGPSGAYCGSVMVPWTDRTLAGWEDAKIWRDGREQVYVTRSEDGPRGQDGSCERTRTLVEHRWEEGCSRGAIGSAWKKAPTISRARACSEDTGGWTRGLGGE